MTGELDLILRAIDDWSERGIEFALATVVGVRGSTYRGLAARQLMAADGASVGTISGGCLDNDLQRVAKEVIERGAPQIVEFDLTADDEAVWGWGIGCNGATELLVEPAIGAKEWGDLLRHGQGALALVHPLQGDQLGRHLVVTEGDEVWAGAAREAIASGHHQRLVMGGLPYLLEVMAGPSRLVVCGAGHDAVPLVQLAAGLGFEVVVVDDRRQFLTRERFPEASALVQCAPDELAAHVEMDPATAVVVMSHNYLRDLGYLKSVLGAEVGYLGCLGPGARLERLLKDLEAEGVSPGPGHLAKVYGPAGLDVGAEGPVEIAWSVMAEILAVRRDRRGGSLRERKGPALWRERGET